MVDEDLNDEQEPQSALDEFNEYFGEEAGEILGRVISEHNAGQQQAIQDAKQLLDRKVGMPSQSRDPATQQFQSTKPQMTEQQRREIDEDERDNRVLDEILGDDDEAEYGEDAPDALTDDATLDQILDGRMTTAAQRRRGLGEAERRRQAEYNASSRGRVGMPDHPPGYSGFEMLR